MSNTLLSLQEVAELVGVHPETLRRWDREGKLTAVKVGERGDRKYRHEDVLRTLAGYAPVEYKNTKITYFSPGFEMFPNRFGSLARFLVSKDKTVAGFAFAVAGLKLFATPKIGSKDLETAALNKIKERIDNGLIENWKEYTFEYESSGFREVQNPQWWVKGSL